MFQVMIFFIYITVFSTFRFYGGEILWFLPSFLVKENGFITYLILSSLDFQTCYIHSSSVLCSIILTCFLVFVINLTSEHFSFAVAVLSFRLWRDCYKIILGLLLHGRPDGERPGCGQFSDNLEGTESLSPNSRSCDFILSRLSPEMELYRVRINFLAPYTNL